MDQNKLLLFNLAKHRMTYLSERQSVLSQNIANADTPGYKAKDLGKVDFKSLLEQTSSQHVQLKTTHPGHIGSGGGGNYQYKVQVDENSFETSPDGNSVQVDEQVLKMNDTVTDYQATTGVYKKMNDLLRLSLGGGGGS